MARSNSMEVIDLDSDSESEVDTQPRDNLPKTSKEKPIDLTLDDDDDEETQSSPNVVLPAATTLEDHSNNPALTPENSPRLPVRVQQEAETPRHDAPTEDEDSDDFFDRLKQRNKLKTKRTKRSLNGPVEPMAVPPSPSPTKKRSARAPTVSQNARIPEEDEESMSIKKPAHLRRLKALNHPGANSKPSKEAQRKDKKTHNALDQKRRAKNILKRVLNASVQDLVPPLHKVDRKTISKSSDTSALSQKERDPSPSTSKDKEDTEFLEVEHDQTMDDNIVSADFSVDVSHFFSPGPELEEEGEAEEEEELDQAAGPYDPKAASRGAGSSHNVAVHKIYAIPQSGWRSRPALSSASTNPTPHESATGSDYASSLSIANASTGKGKRPLTQRDPTLREVTNISTTVPTAVMNGAGNKKRKRPTLLNSDESDVDMSRGGEKRPRGEHDLSQNEIDLYSHLDRIQASLASKNEKATSTEFASEGKSNDASEIPVHQADTESNNALPENVIETEKENANANENEDQIGSDVEMVVAGIETAADEPAVDNREESEVDELDKSEPDELENNDFTVTLERPDFLNQIRDSRPSPVKRTDPGYPSPLIHTLAHPALSSDGLAEVEGILMDELSSEPVNPVSPQGASGDHSMQELEDEQYEPIYTDHTPMQDERSTPDNIDEPLVNNDIPTIVDTPRLPTIIEPLERERKKLLDDNKDLLNRVPGFQGGYQRPSMTPLYAPWEILRPYFKRRLELERESLEAYAAQRRQESSVEL